MSPKHAGEQLAPDATGLGTEELGRLLAVGRSLVSELDVESVLRLVLETARDLTGARYAALGILDERKHALERFVFVGMDEETRRVIGPLPRGQGVLGELIRDPRPLRCADVCEHPRSYGFPVGHPPMTTFLGVPVSIRGEAWGNLYLTEKEGPGEFTEKDEQLLKVLSEWAAVAIDNARLYESLAQRHGELERAVRGLEATSAIAGAVGFETDLARVLELIVKRGRAITDARSFLVLLQEGDVLRVAAAAGEETGDVVDMEIPVDGSLAGTVAASAASETVSDLRARVGHGLGDVTKGARSALLVPLGFRGRATGVLVALDRLRDGPAFDGDDAHILASFASSAGIAIATAQSVGDERMRQSLRAADAERARWAGELHDETLQELALLKVLIDTVSDSDDLGRVRIALDEVRGQIELSIRNLQELITELRPAALHQIGLAPAIEALVKRVAVTSGLTVKSDVRLAFDEGLHQTRLEPEIEVALYRLTQEALTNAVKHAGAEHVTVELLEVDDVVRLCVSDDGGGFDPEAVSEGYGLVGMQERVTLVSGEVSVESAPGQGTTVKATVEAGHRPETDSQSGASTNRLAS